jgi:uncharacterized protein (TIGR03435 family)
VSGLNWHDRERLLGETGRASLFKALREQVGLTLDPQNAPIEVLVIDHVERPSAN